MKRAILFLVVMAVAVPSFSFAQKYSSKITGAKERMNNGDYEKAIEILLEAEEFMDEKKNRIHEVEYMLGVCYYRKVRYQEALGAFKKSQANGKKYTKEGMNLTQVGFHPIPTYIESCMSLIFTNSKNLFNTVQANTDEKERIKGYATVIDQLNLLLTYDPNYANAHVLLGNTYNDLANIVTAPDTIKQYRLNAIKSYETILKTQENLTVYLVVGQLHNLVDNVDQSIAVLEKALKIETDDKETRKQVLYQLILVYNQREKYERGATYLAALLEKSKDEEMNRAIIPPLAIFYDQTGKSEKAIKMYREALKKEPDNVDLWYNLGRLYLDKKQFEEGIKAFLKAKELQPDDVDLAYLVADEYYFLCDKKRKTKIEEMGGDEADEAKVFTAVQADYTAAIPHIESAIEKIKVELTAKPEDMQTEVKLNHQAGRLLVHLALINGYLAGPNAESKKRSAAQVPFYEKALPYLEKSVSLDDSRKGDWMQLGQIYANLGMMDKAQEAFKKAE